MECSSCGEKDPDKFRPGKKQCVSCIATREKARKDRLKIEWEAFISEHKGDKCCICGYNEVTRALELHHIYPHKKRLKVAEFIYNKPCNEGNKAILFEEFKMLIRVCNRCHVELHDKGAIM